MSDLDLDDDDTADGDEAAPVPRERARAGRRRSATTNRWMRWLHTYTSMISMVVVLFFGLTGLTLNHPSWTLGDHAERSEHKGTLPTGYLTAAGAPDYLRISEFVRRQYSVLGDVADYGVSGNEGTISYKGPGYAADLYFEVDKGTFDLVVEQQGFVGVLNDLHKGRDTSPLWKWVIDVSAIGLVLVSLTGLGIQLFQRKRRTRALIAAGVGAVVTIVLIFVTMV